MTNRAETENDCVYSNQPFWVYQRLDQKGRFDVMQDGATHATKVATFYFSSRPGYAFSRAVEDCDRRKRLINGGSSKW